MNRKMCCLYPRMGANILRLVSFDYRKIYCYHCLCKWRGGCSQCVTDPSLLVRFCCDRIWWNIFIFYITSHQSFLGKSQVKAKEDNEKTVGIFFKEAFPKYSINRSGVKVRGGLVQEGVTEKITLKCAVYQEVHQESGLGQYHDGYIHIRLFIYQGPGEKYTPLLIICLHDREARSEHRRRKSESSGNGFLGTRQGDWRCSRTVWAGCLRYFTFYFVFNFWMEVFGLTV